MVALNNKTTDCISAYRLIYAHTVSLSHAFVVFGNFLCVAVGNMSKLAMSTEASVIRNCA